MGSASAWAQGPSASCRRSWLSCARIPRRSARYLDYTSRFYVPVIADCGISIVGHVMKEAALGAGARMMGGMLADTTEAPGEYLSHEGKRIWA